jgi:hypothetical protein
MHYLFLVKPISQPRPIEPEKLKPALHDKIERMDGLHLSLLNRVLLNWRRKNSLDAWAKASTKTMSKACWGAFLH